MQRMALIIGPNDRERLFKVSFSHYVQWPMLVSSIPIHMWGTEMDSPDFKVITEVMAPLEHKYLDTLVYVLGEDITDCSWDIDDVVEGLE